MPPFVIAAVGAGGKTTALLHLARALSLRAVLLTTTTHMFPVRPPLCRSLLLDPSPTQLQEQLRRGYLCGYAFYRRENGGASRRLAAAIYPRFRYHALRSGRRARLTTQAAPSG